jgi:hypothetical protein
MEKEGDGGGDREEAAQGAPHKSDPHRSEPDLKGGASGATTPAGEEAKRREIRQPGLERGEEGAVVGRREGVYFITTHQRREYGGDREARDDSGGTSMALFFLTV